MWLFQKTGPKNHPGPTENTETPKNGLKRAKIGVNAPHVVELTGFGPKKTNFRLQWEFQCENDQKYKMAKNHFSGVQMVPKVSKWGF